MISTTTKQGFEALFNNAAIGIITVNQNAEIVLINKFALHKFGYEKEDELTGKKIEVLIPQRYKHKHEGHRNGYLSHHSQNRPMGIGLDLFAVKKDGTEFPVEVSLSSYEVEGHKYAIAFVNDITVRKQSEEALLKLNEHLEELVEDRTHTLKETVDKLEIQIAEAKEKDIQLRQSLEKEKELNELKSKFVSMASHEFRTPLTTILSSVYLIGQYTGSDDQPKRTKHIEKIVSSVNMLDDILNDFLSVGKIEEGRIKIRAAEFNLAELINSIIGQLTTILKKDQNIVHVHKGGEVIDFLDPALMKHILMNLISNAIKFSPENKTITISTDFDKDILSISVQDHGIGIPKQDLDHLFERFYRGSNVSNIQGTGLGLHIVSKYVEFMGGTIECETQQGKGTEFTISFNKKNRTNDENHPGY